MFSRAVRPPASWRRRTDSARASSSVSARRRSSSAWSSRRFSGSDMAKTVASLRFANDDREQGPITDPRERGLRRGDRRGRRLAGVGPDTGRLWLDTFIADVLATLVVFAFSRAYRNSSFYDAYWSVIPPLLLFYWWSQSGPGVDQVRCWLVAIVVMLLGDTPDRQLGLRLPRPAPRGLALSDVARTRGPLGVLRRPVRDPPDPHGAGVRRHAAGVRRGHPAGHRSSAWLAWVAFAIGLAAVTLELVADVQMHRFVKDRRDGQAMDRGLWGWSRHPNYFGEFSFWFALGAVRGGGGAGGGVVAVRRRRR